MTSTDTPTPPSDDTRKDFGRVPDAGTISGAPSGGSAGPTPGPTLGQAAAMVAGFLGLQILFGLGFAVAADMRGEKPDVALMTLVGGLVTALIMLGWVYLNVKREGRAFSQALGFRPIRLTPGETFWTVFTIYFAVRVASGLYAWGVLDNAAVEGAGERTADATFAGASGLQTILLWLFIAGIGPMTEEIIFRGYLQSALMARYSAWMAIAVAAAVFATAHFELTLWPMYFMLGLGFGAAYYRTGSVRPAILLHMVNNAMALGAHAAGFV